MFITQIRYEHSIWLRRWDLNHTTSGLWENTLKTQAHQTHFKCSYFITKTIVLRTMFSRIIPLDTAPSHRGWCHILVSSFHAVDCPANRIKQSIRRVFYATPIYPLGSMPNGDERNKTTHNSSGWSIAILQKSSKTGCIRYSRVHPVFCSLKSVK